MLAVSRHRTGDVEHSVFPGRVEWDRTGGTHRHLGSDQRAEHCRPREGITPTPDENLSVVVPESHRWTPIDVFECGGHASHRFGEGNPQLNRVKRVRTEKAAFAVGHAGTRGHQVESPRRDGLGRTQAVTVVHGAVEEPGHGLQSRVRMCGDRHAIDLRGRSEMIDKNPGTDFA